MLDIKFVRENPDAVDKSCASRQNAHWDRERFFELDEERRATIVEVEGLQAERHAASKPIGQLMREGKRDEAEAAKAKVAANKSRIAELETLRGDQMIMEVKFTEFLPRQVRSLLPPRSAELTAASKYVLCCDAAARQMPMNRTEGIQWKR